VAITTAAAVAGADPVTAAALPAGVVAAAAGHQIGAAGYRARAARVETALAGFLDRLERSDRGGSGEGAPRPFYL
ncbi:MAG: hypothetical protein ACRD0F_05780, partial [Acidimicrobiales bacterium]